MAASSSSKDMSTLVQNDKWNNIHKKIDLEDRKKKNTAWISAFKKTHGVKKQSVLPSATMQHNEWAIKSGWSMSDATVWRGLCEKAKFAMDDTEGVGILCLLSETVAMANHCDSHPIGLIHFARTSHGRPVWDLDTLDYLKDHLLDEVSSTPPGSPEMAVPGALDDRPRTKRRLNFEEQATQPSDTDDDVIRD